METRYRDRTWLDPRLVLRASHIHSRGLVALQSFRVNEVAIVFGGTLFSREDVIGGKSDKWTLMQVGQDLWLGNVAGQPLDEDYFINHSRDPNLWITNDLSLTARKEIQIGEEVTMDYATHFADPAWTMKNTCNCAIHDSADELSQVETGY